MQEFLVEIDQSTTTTYAVQASTEAEAIDRYAEYGRPIHSESVRSEPRVVRDQSPIELGDNS
ncbi:hypothetical protein SEA_EMIANNA_74 [Gordonia phage Emianna]|uniref:Uncharacterized protein n=4 Tax=Foxborovirus TaxID=2948710 RepID=A0A385UDU9_9CAUD|nr:hypothetical protein KNT99_gp74 [Gordonia phage NatB6]YP_010098330.1 hypothetical protein KNU10_gp74 [Gordonia phage Foxboro]YP_010098422.1 hypothetical protein KNU11_gp74 [Gordonia phage KidneyBean]YP_010098962.1 hypothetical protein KNU15_gp74 [Gordonia phage Emianna]AYD84188.1 hypothetical protein SEA_JIFALL16_73 [Gordonia phage Jifall16]AYD84346.1 hypothetical protein SEA_KURT_74 [Gordonia phage Kurt]QOP66735.1 hypothetical protein SEA_NOVUMREGINA_74 [Gordonia phage NovumRegina]QOR559